MIVTQMPLLDTVTDFYKLIAAEKCSVIVMLNTLEKIDKVSFSCNLCQKMSIQNVNHF